MKGKSSSLITVIGIVVLGIFIAISIYNILPKNRQSNSYYVKIGDSINAEIEAIDITDGYLTMETSGDASKYCVKSTKTTPTVNALCWKDVVDNKSKISVYEYKEYFVWVMDSNKNISNAISINAKDNK